MGIALSDWTNRPSLAWQIKGGHLPWLPYWSKRTIIHISNRLLCFRYGHDWCPVAECCGRTECLHCPAIRTLDQTTSSSAA